MRRWLALGLTGLALAWAPYIYSELARKPLVARSTDEGAASESPSAEIDATNRAHDVQAGDTPAPVIEASLSGLPALARATPPVVVPDEAAHALPAPPTAAASEAKPMAAVTSLSAVRASPPTAAAPEATPKPGMDTPQLNAEPPPKAAATVGAEPTSMPGELAGPFRKTFEAETRDAFWAVDEEARLGALMQASGFAQARIAELACRKTVCRMVYGTSDLDHDVEQKFWGRVRELYGSTLALERLSTGSEPQAAVYVLRAGFRLEPPPAR
jgi:hypothetical protein